MKQKKYLPRSWIDPRIVVKDSPIEGKGLFAAQNILEGEVLMIWGGIPVPKNEFDETIHRDLTMVPIDDNTYLGLLKSDISESIDEYLNHSCDPSGWLIDEVTVVARRNILTEQEITVDAATWDADEDWLYVEDGKCLCGTPQCRKIITPHDWKIQKLQKIYKYHFSPYIERKIKQYKKTLKLTPV